MSRPSFQFYPDDWLANANLRRCSWAARGAWSDVICFMHDSDRYGVLEWSLKEIAQAVGCPRALLNELVAKGVMKGCDAGECQPLIYTPRSGRKVGPPVTLIPAQPGPIWYSSRLVRDEYLRTVRGDGSRFGGANGGTPKAATGDASNRAPKPPIGEGQSDGSPSSSSSPPSDSSETTSRPAEASPSPAATEPPDVRAALWSEGLARLRRLTGKPDKAARGLLGQFCRDAHDDCALIASLLHEAEVQRVGDPVPWLQAAIRTRTGARAASGRRESATERRTRFVMGLYGQDGSAGQPAFDIDGEVAP